MPSSERAAEAEAARLQSKFAGKLISFEPVAGEDEFMIFVLSQEPPFDLQKMVAKGWFCTQWIDAEHRGYRCTIVKA